MVLTNINANNRVNPVFELQDLISENIAVRILNAAVPIMKMHSATKTVATILSASHSMLPLGLEMVRAYHKGDKRHLAIHTLRVLFTVSSVAGLILYPVPAMVITYTYQFSADIISLFKHLKKKDFELATKYLLKILNQAVHLSSSIKGGPELLLLSLILQAGKEVYQAKLEFAKGSKLEGFANLLYVTLRILEAREPAYTCRRKWFYKPLSQHDYYNIFYKYPKLDDQILLEHGFSNQLNGLSIAEGKYEGITLNDCSVAGYNTTFDKTVFNNCFIKMKFELGISTFNKCVFSFCKYSGDARKSYFNNCMFSNITINSSHRGSEFKECFFENCSLASAYLPRFFTSCVFKKSNFEISDYSFLFEDCLFEGCALINANFLERELKNLTFLRCDLTGSNFNNTSQISTIYQSCILSEASFFNVRVHDSKMIDCELKNCLLFDSKKNFEIIKCTPHVMTKPVIAMIYDRSWPKNRRTDNDFKSQGAILFKLPNHPWALNHKLEDEVIGILNTSNDSAPRPQVVLDSAELNSEIEKIKNFAGRITSFVDGIFLESYAISKDSYDVPSVVPLFYGKSTEDHEKEGIAKNIIDFALLQEAKKRNLPALGFDCGLKTINAFFGGTNSVLQKDLGNGMTVSQNGLIIGTSFEPNKNVIEYFMKKAKDYMNENHTLENVG